MDTDTWQLCTCFAARDTAKTKDQYLAEKERFSLSTSMVPTLPAYGYTAKGLQLVDGSNVGLDDRVSMEDDWEELTLCANSLSRVRRVGTSTVLIDGQRHGGDLAEA